MVLLPPPLLLLSIILPIILLPSPSTANEGNILATGDTLPTDGQLSYDTAAFAIQDDCNLVLYNQANGFQSNTHGLGTNCTLTLSDRGQLIIKTGNYIIWSSPGGPKRGKYIAVLGPDGIVNVFGPSVFSTPPPSSPFADIEDDENGTTLVRNVMFSSQVLAGNSTLASRDYSLAVTAACNVELRKASAGVVWQSRTAGKGRRCGLTLDDRGRLVLVAGANKKAVWATAAAGAKGEYVLVVEIHGQAVVYGPVVWSTGS